MTGEPRDFAKKDAGIDPAPLQRLLHLSGPEGAELLITAMLADLAEAQRGLTAAWFGPDFAALRVHSHVLIALAGTIGDRRLQMLSQQLNNAAHQQDSAEIADLAPGIVAGLGALIRFVADAGAPNGGQR